MIKSLAIAASLAVAAALAGAENLLPENPHKFGRSNAEIRDAGWRINALPEKWNAIQATLPLKQSYYRLRFEYQAPPGVTVKLRTMPESTPEYVRQYMDSHPDGKWRTMTGWLRLPADGPAKIIVAVETPTPQTVEVRNLQMEALPEEPIRIVVDETAAPVWQAQWALRDTKYAFTYVDAPLHIDGGKALRFTPEPGGKANIQSQSFPVQAGKKYRLSVWIRSSVEVAGEVQIDGWVNKGPTHWYQTERTRLAGEWKEYLLPFTAPEEAVYRGLMCVQIRSNAPVDWLEVKDIECKEMP